MIKRKRFLSFMCALMMISSEIMPVYAGADDVSDEVIGEASDDMEMHSVSIDPAELTTLPGGEWMVEAVAEPVLEVPDDEWTGARYEWEKTSQKQ